MAIGGSCILTALSMMNKEFWKLAREQKASLFPGVPYHYEMLAKLGLNRIDCPDFDIFLQAGGKLSDELTRELWQQIAQRRGKFFVMYGQTEASPRISCLAVHEHQGKIGTCGKVLAGGTLAIEDGEVIYTGPNVMMGYAKNRADVAKGDDMHGKLRTGDMGTLQDGYLIITGRRQRFAKLFGQRIALENIEAIVGKVAPTIAIEKADRIVLATTAQNDTYEKIGKLVETETSLSSTWFEIRHIDTIPRNSNGKVDYCKLREML
jgi:long-subunit acyl-CoA synthetase (AMP-forming)